VVTQAYNPSTQKDEAGGSPISGQPDPLIEKERRGGRSKELHNFSTNVKILNHVIYCSI
jgi:hypothetical protein